MLLKADKSGIRIDIYISSSTDYTRSQVRKLIKEGLVLLNSEKIKNQSKKVKKGDIIEIIEVKKDLSIQPKNIPIKIIYKDNDIIAVHKPYGLLTHPTSKERENTLVNAIMHIIKKELPVLDDFERPGIVHRLDKLTEGIILIALNHKAMINLQKQFSERVIKKTYIAIVHNKPKTNEGIIEKHIKRGKRGKFRTGETGRESITEYKLLLSKEINKKTYSKLMLFPKTGRTHQIRVHLVSIGLPIVGDPLYSRHHKQYNRMYLLAKSIGFYHPNTKKWMVLETEEPKDFMNFFNT